MNMGAELNVINKRICLICLDLDSCYLGSEGLSDPTQVPVSVAFKLSVASPVKASAVQP